jgi:putative GTP pyrophosphokinase
MKRASHEEETKLEEAILEQYDHKLHLYMAFTKKVHDLIIKILAENDIHVHSVTDRVKSRESLTKKLSRPDGNYADLGDITDIAGIRITTYFEDDVDRVAKVIAKEFKVDTENSVDKRELLDPDRFGYLSMHHVLSLTTERCRLTEYKRFPKLKAEIQTRSILQHAWAEIEHDLGYKSSQEVPQSTRRRFSRLAGLLELADQEFINIKNELIAYEKAVPARIQKAPQLVTIDKASLAAFVHNSALVKELDLQIASFTQGTIVRNDAAIARHVRRLQTFGVETIRELEKVLNENAADIIEFAKGWLKKSTHTRYASGVSVLYLGYLFIARTKDPTQIRGYLNLFRVGQRGDDRERLVNRVMETYEDIGTA